LIFEIYSNLIIARISIQKIIIGLPCKSFKHLIHERKWIMVLPGSIIQLLIVNAYSPLMQSYPPRVLDRRIQEDWARATKEGPRVLMNLKVDL